MNCHTLKFKVRYSTPLRVRYHSKFCARSTATAIFEETAEFIQGPICKRAEKINETTIFKQKINCHVSQN